MNREKNVKGKLTKGMEFVKNNLRRAILCSTMLFIVFSSQVYAATDTSSVTAPLESLKTLMLSVIGAVGVIILAKNVMELAQAYQQQDSSSMNSAIKGVVAGLMMAGISSVLALLGF